MLICEGYLCYMYLKLNGVDLLKVLVIDYVMVFLEFKFVKNGKLVIDVSCFIFDFVCIVCYNFYKWILELFYFKISVGLYFECCYISWIDC